MKLWRHHLHMVLICTSPNTEHQLRFRCRILQEKCLIGSVRMSKMADAYYPELVSLPKAFLTITFNSIPH